MFSSFLKIRKSDKHYTFEISIKLNSFDVTIGTKIPFIRVLVTIEIGRSLLTLHYCKLFDKVSKSKIGSTMDIYILTARVLKHQQCV